MTVDLIVALIGTGTVSVVAGKLVDLFFGRGKRLRFERGERLRWERAAIVQHRCALTLFVLASAGGVEGLPEVPALPDFVDV